MMRRRSVPDRGESARSGRAWRGGRFDSEAFVAGSRATADWRAASGSGPGGRRGNRESDGRGQRAQGSASRRSGSGRGECRLRKSYRPSQISDLGGRDSGAPGPSAFRSLMRNPAGSTLPIRVWAIGKPSRGRAPGPNALGAGADLDEDGHLPICRLSRPDGALFSMRYGLTHNGGTRSESGPLGSSRFVFRAIHFNRGARGESGPENFVTQASHRARQLARRR